MSVTINPSTPLVKIGNVEQDNQYPVYLRQVREENNQISFPDNPELSTIRELGYDIVVETDQPEGDVVVEGMPVLDQAGKWVQTWTVRAHTPEENATALSAAKAAARSQIDVLLAVALDKGFPFTFETGVGHVQLRTIDRTNILGASMNADRRAAAGETGAVCPFRTYENITHMCTPAQMHQLSNEAYEAYLGFLQMRWELKDAVELAEDLSEMPVLPEELVLPVQ